MIDDGGAAAEEESPDSSKIQPKVADDDILTSFKHTYVKEAQIKEFVPRLIRSAEH